MYRLDLLSGHMSSEGIKSMAEARNDLSMYGLQTRLCGARCDPPQFSW